MQEYALFGVVSSCFIAGAILERDVFMSTDNIFNVLRQGSVIGVLAIGMTFVIATAGIDLSVGSMVAAAAIAAAVQLVDSGQPGCSCSAAVGIGSCSARSTLAVAYGKVVPFIATLAML